MRSGSRAEFVSTSGRWIVVRSVALNGGERGAMIDGWLAEAKVVDWIDDVASLPAMLALYEDVSGSQLFAPTTFEVEALVKPALQEAFRRGRLVALKERPALLEKEDVDQVLHGPSVDPIPALPKKAPQIIKEKTFLDLQVINARGTPLAGRRYKIQLPDGKTETTTLGADARITKTGIDPGTATFTFLPNDGDVFHAGDAPNTPEGDTLVIFLQDGDGQALANAVYRLRIAGETREGTAGGDGRLEEQGIPEADVCHLYWGPPPSGDAPSGNPYVFSQRLYLEVEGSDEDATERQLANLGYVDGSLDERLVAFQNEYDGSALDVQQNGTAGKPDSGSGEAVA